MFGNIWNSQRKYFNKLIDEYPKFFLKSNGIKTNLIILKFIKKIDLLVCTSETESYPLSIF